MKRSINNRTERSEKHISLLALLKERPMNIYTGRSESADSSAVKKRSINVHTKRSEKHIFSIVEKTFEERLH